MAFLNLSFETVGPQAGCAAGWVLAAHGQRAFAVFGTSPWEAFESGWSTNEAYKFAFSGFTIDLTQASYVTLQPFVKLVENFDELWTSNHLYVYTLASTPALYDSTPEAREDFEEEWASNESYLYAFAGIGVDLTAADYDSSPEAFEDFEEGWTDPYLYAFVGYGTDLTLANYDAAITDFEDFEDEWPLVVMTTI